MQDGPLGIAVLVVAGAAAGLVGTAGGITSLVSYPALLAVGLGPLPATVTNIVASVACWPGAAIASGPELKGRQAWLLRWALVMLAGDAAGSALLLLTPGDLFARLVPFLLATAVVVLASQPRLLAWRQKRSRSTDHLLLPSGLAGVSVYNGYFGAGSGIMTLALLLLTVEHHLATANALKNMLVGAATVASAAIFIFLGPVRWADCLPLSAGLFAGSMAGPSVARHLPGDLVRWLAALAGAGLAVKLWVAPG